MSIFPNFVKNVKEQTLSDSFELSRRLLEKMLDLSPLLKIRATEQSLHDRNKIANERQVNNYDKRIDRDMCTFVFM